MPKIAKTASHTAWLSSHAHEFGTKDKLPCPEVRRVIFAKIKTGVRVAFATPQGMVVLGVTVMRGSVPDTWICNMGGPHGRPGICTSDNVVWVAGLRDYRKLAGEAGR